MNVKLLFKELWIMNYKAVYNSISISFKLRFTMYKISYEVMLLFSLFVNKTCFV